MYEVLCQPSFKEFGDGHLKAPHIAKAACVAGLSRTVKYSLIQSIWGMALISSHMSLRCLDIVIKIVAITAYNVTKCL